MMKYKYTRTFENGETDEFKGTLSELSIVVTGFLRSLVHYAIGRDEVLSIDVSIGEERFQLDLDEDALVATVIEKVNRGDFQTWNKEVK